MSAVAANSPIQASTAVVSNEMVLSRVLVRDVPAIPPVEKIADSVSITSSLEARKKADQEAAELAQNYRMVPEGISAYEIIQKIQVADASLQANTLVRLRIPLDAAA